MSANAPSGRTLELVTHLQRGGTKGFWCFESVERKTLDSGVSVPIERESWWWDSDCLGPLPPLIGPHGYRNVWFGVHPCSEVPPTRKGKDKLISPRYVRSQYEYICAINCLYAEFDAKDFSDDKEAAWQHIAKLPAGPSVVIDSGGGYHCYWLLRDTWQIDDTNRDDAKALQAAWVAAVGGDGGAKNLTRVLRVPGSYNYKPQYGPEYPCVSYRHWDISKQYVLDELRKMIPAEALERADQGSAPPATLDDFERAPKLLQMLSRKRLDDYDSWLHVGMSLAGLGRHGLDLWDAWSRGGSTYKPGECERKWSGLGDSGRTFASLVAWAREDSPDEFARAFSQRKAHDVKGTGLLQVEVEPKASSKQPNLKMLCRGVEDEGNARAVQYLHGDKFLHCDVYGWLHWCGTHWRRHGAESKLERAIVDTLIQRRKAAVELGNETIVKTAKPTATHVRSAKFLFRSMVEVHVDDFDRDPDLLNCANGTIHLPSGELRKHNPADRLTYCTNVTFKWDADESEWVQFLRGAVAQAGSAEDLINEMVTYLQKCCGYSLTGHTSEEVLWYIYGPPRSGKGTFTETIYQILGVPLSTEVDFNTFTRDRDNDANNFDLAPLKPARLVFASESERHQRINGAKVKALTGGNMVRCSFKGKDHFTYKPQYKIWLSSNHKPNGDPDDDALWGRLRLVVFPNSHLGKEDKGLKARMRDPETLEGVLAWAVKGAKAWYEDRNTGLDTPAEVHEQTTGARAEVDTVGQWIEECVERSPEYSDLYITNADIYQRYLSWCEENGVTPKKKAGLTRSLNAKGIDGPSPKKISGKTQRVWLGIGWI